MDKEKEQAPEGEKRKSREELADEVLEIFSDSPEEMASLIELLRKMEGNAALRSEKRKPDTGAEKGPNIGSTAFEKEDSDRKDRS